MRITEKMVMDGMMTDIQSHLSEIAKIQQQISTGRRIQTVSDDPVGASKSIDLTFTLRSLEQYKTNADEAKAWMSTTLSNLAQVRDAINEAKTLALQGSTDSMPPDARLASAQTVDRLRDRVLNIANTKWRGTYIFSGHKTSTAAFSGAGQYQGDAGAMRRRIGPEESIVVNYDGNSVFKDGGDLFRILEDLKASFENNDVPGIASKISSLDDSLDNILKLEAIMGSDFGRVESATTRLEDGQMTLKTLQAENDDVDLAGAIVRLQSLQNTYQAALSTSAQVLEQSLLRFLK